MNSSRRALDALAAALLAALVALVALAVAQVVHGAPIPPPPKELPAAALVGKWQYRWGWMDAGTMWVFPDGTYTAVHGRGHPGVCTGTWAVEGWTLVLTETVYDAEKGTVSGPRLYRVEFPADRYPRLRGTWNGHTPVELSNPQR